jgi:hypothetical protein
VEKLRRISPRGINRIVYFVSTIVNPRNEKYVIMGSFIHDRTFDVENPYATIDLFTTKVEACPKNFIDHRIEFETKTKLFDFIMDLQMNHDWKSFDIPKENIVPELLKVR